MDDRKKIDWKKKKNNNEQTLRDLWELQQKI